jgi:hypothetical protein
MKAKIGKDPIWKSINVHKESKDNWIKLPFKLILNKIIENFNDMVKILNTEKLGHRVSNGFNGTHNLGRGPKL